MNTNNPQKRRWLYAIAGCLAMVFMGCSFSWGVFVVPLEEKFGWLRTQTSLAFTLNVMCFSLGTILAGIFSKKFSFSQLIIGSGILIGLGFFTTSFVTQVWQVYLSYSILCGCGIGLGYNCVVSTVPRWFPEKTGLVSGILLVGYAMSSGVLSPILDLLILNTGISATFRILSVICLAGLVAVSPFFKVPTPTQIAALPRPKIKITSACSDVPLKQAVKMPLFWLTFLITAVAAGVGQLLLNHVSPLMIEEFAVSSTTAALALTLGAAANAAGRLICGIVYDKLGVNKTISLVSFCVVSFSILGVVALSLGSMPLFLVSAMFGLFSYGCNATSIPTVTRVLFGESHFPMNYSVISANALLSALLPTAVGALQIRSGSYLLPFQALLAVAALDVVVLLLFTRLNKQSPAK